MVAAMFMAAFLSVLIILIKMTFIVSYNLANCVLNYFPMLIPIRYGGFGVLG